MQGAKGKHKGGGYQTPSQYGTGGDEGVRDTGENVGSIQLNDKDSLGLGKVLSRLKDSVLGMQVLRNADSGFYECPLAFDAESVNQVKSCLVDKAQESLKEGDNPTTLYFDHPLLLNHGEAQTDDHLFAKIIYNDGIEHLKQHVHSDEHKTQIILANPTIVFYKMENGKEKEYLSCSLSPDGVRNIYFHSLDKLFDNGSKQISKISNFVTQSGVSLLFLEYHDIDFLTDNPITVFDPKTGDSLTQGIKIYHVNSRKEHSIFGQYNGLCDKGGNGFPYGKGAFTFKLHDWWCTISGDFKKGIIPGEEYKLQFHAPGDFRKTRHPIFTMQLVQDGDNFKLQFLDDKKNPVFNGMTIAADKIKTYDKDISQKFILFIDLFYSLNDNRCIEQEVLDATLQNTTGNTARGLPELQCDDVMLSQDPKSQAIEAGSELLEVLRGMGDSTTLGLPPGLEHLIPSPPGLERISPGDTAEWPIEIDTDSETSRNV